MIADVQTPANREELLAMITKMNGHPFRFIAGGTDILLELKDSLDPVQLINLGSMQDDEMQAIVVDEQRIHIGALVTVAQLEDHDTISKEFPVLARACWELASPQIRATATVGGNLCTASPAADIGCALVALDAECTMVDDRGVLRTLPLDSFFSYVKQTVIKPNEVLIGVSFSRQHHQHIHSQFIKVGVRRAMEISIVALAAHFGMDHQKRIVQAGLAIGSVAPTIRNIPTVDHGLIGQTLGDISNASIDQVVEAVISHSDPISDSRASSWYRRRVLANITRSLFE